MAGLSVGGRQRNARIQNGEMSRSDPVVVDGCLYGQNFDEIKARCLENGELFVDEEFPPDDGSLWFSDKQYGVEWRRPHELVEEPSLMEGGGDRFDINQVQGVQYQYVIPILTGFTQKFDTMLV